ncbi:MAG: hypothetical protein K0Q75_27 [Anaerospora sp.]|jgi:glycosyltransferase involved in cell wall biosynthesis|nr:hypothetical protein [Anaerospora sp.]
MRTSIVLATYNGEKYILEQLNSILNQTRVPDEIVICDDRSTDNTRELVSNFIRNNSLNNWKLIVNDINKGFRKNFIDGIYKTTGDVIFFSDQDDIWPSDKVEVMAKAMESNRDILALAGFRVVVDKEGNTPPFTYPYPISGETKKISKIEFNERNCSLSRSGCITCFSNELISYIKDLWIDGMSHDFIVWRLACILGGAYEIDYTVLKFRIHTQNTSGVSVDNYLGKGEINSRIEGIKFEINWFEKYLNYIKRINITNKSEKTKILQKYIDMLKQREKFLSTKNILYGLKLIKYKSYYSTFSKLIGDFAYAYGINKVCGEIFWGCIHKSTKKQIH